MAKTNWQDPKTGEMISPHISGLQEAVGKLEESVGIETVDETNIPLSEVFISNDDRCRIYQAPEGKRNWVLTSVPVIKKNGIVITDDFEIEYGGGGVIFTTPLKPSDKLTANATYTKKISISDLLERKLDVSEKTTINGKTGAIKKEDIVALGIPEKDTIYSHPTSNGWRHIPYGGVIGQILRNTANGTVSWQDESVTPIANNLTETTAGKALDARQGKALDDKIKNIPSPTIATKLEAEAGTNNTKMMTPLRVKEAVVSNPLWENTKGSISSKTDTGDVTTEHSRQVNVSHNSSVSMIRSQINTSYSCTIKGMPIDSDSQINSSKDSIISTSNSQINCSDNVLNNKPHTSVWGHGSDKPSTQNIKTELNARYGTVKASGAITGNSSFADFAEYFESVDGKSIPLGTIVSLGEGGKVKVANQGEYMVGIISQTAGIILNAQGFEWKDRYLYDRYGQPIMVDREIENEETGEIETIKAPMLNVDWNENEEYVGREDREEWNVVGLTGQIFINVDDTVREGDFIKVKDNGIGTKGRNEYGQNWQVMKITTEYEENLGFGIALVFVR